MTEVERAKKTPELSQSVQMRPDADSGMTSNVAGDVTSWITTVHGTVDECPSYWSKARDAWLRSFVYRPGNDLLAGTISTVVAKIATTGWSIEGPERAANLYRNKLLRYSEFGDGWSAMVQKTCFDYFSQDMGGTFERIRTGRRDISGAALGFAHLDSAQIELTGNPMQPVKYFPATPPEGEVPKPVTMNAAQIMRIVDSPSPQERKFGVGFCAVSRAITMANILIDIARYERERLSDLPPAGILLLNNLTRNQWEDLEKSYEANQRQQGNEVWRDIMVGFGLDPTVPIGAEILSFSNLPEHFDKRVTYEISVYAFAMAFRIDPREIWPVSAGPLGTATEAKIQHMKARTKGSGLVLTDIERKLNDGNSMPRSLTFRFDVQDIEEDEQYMEIADGKARMIRRLWEPAAGGLEGMVTTEEARRWLIKQRIFEEEDLGTYDDQGTAEDNEVARGVDLGPRVRAYSDGRTLRLQKGRSMMHVSKQILPAGGVNISPDDVARAFRRWDREVPESGSILTAPSHA